ncbi:hypothetical protein TNCV_3627721 [Trichonephila clavipes]|nr:hypothetical protein TNCV_3627721 [Trichonephila clavipes]
MRPARSAAMPEWMATTYSNALDSMNTRLTSLLISTGRFAVKWSRSQARPLAGWVAWLFCRWPSAPKVAGSTPTQVGRFSWCRISTAAMSYDFQHVKDPKSVCLVWMLSAKLNPGAGSHWQSSGASLLWGKWASKLPVTDGIRL